MKTLLKMIVVLVAVIIAATSANAEIIRLGVETFETLPLNEALTEMRELTSYDIVLLSSDKINAFAYEGKIYVMDSILNILSREELMSVLFHEEGHLTLKHADRIIEEYSQYYKSNKESINEREAFYIIKRKHEKEADAYSAKKMRQLGFSPMHSIAALARLNKTADEKMGLPPLAIIDDMIRGIFDDLHPSVLIRACIIINAYFSK